MMTNLKILLLIVCGMVLSGCATMAQPTPDSELDHTLVKPALYDRLPADYELPPYIRIASLPLVDRGSSTAKKNAPLLGDYWLFSNTGYTLDVGALPSIDAANAYIAHHALNPDKVRFIRLGGGDSLSIGAFYGHYQSREAALKAQHALPMSSTQITSIRALKAKRCELINTPSIDALCNGAPVKTLSIAEVVE